MRDHSPIILEEFNGWWSRGDIDAVPIDHFSDAENLAFFQSGFRTRDGIAPYRAVSNPIRMYNYVMQEGQSLLLLTEEGDIYHSINEDTLYGPILSIPGMEDFTMVSIAGRAYINPIERTVTEQGMTREVGMQDEVLYVYLGDGEDARPAAGFPPTNDDDTPLVAYNSDVDGVIDQGIHVIGVTFGDGADDSTSVGTSIRPIIYAPGQKQAYVQNIPIGGMGITQRNIWMTKAITPESYDPSGSYTYYLAKSVLDNSTISTIVDIADVDLVTAFVAGGLPNPTSGGIEIENTGDEGYCDVGLHIIGVVYETDTGYLTAPGPEVLGVQSFVNENRAIHISNIPTSPDSFVTRRHLVGSRKVENYNGDDLGYQLYFIPGGTLDDNSTTEIQVSYYDVDLIDDASHLLDNYSEIPAGVSLTTYHGRLVSSTSYDDISLLFISFAGEPEAISQIDGINIIPLDGNPITTAQEFRDILYVFKQTRTYALSDNGDIPATWQPIVVDQGIGCCVHGISTVLDSGGVNVDYITIVDYSGVMIFNGAYQRPEMSYKIKDYWLDLDRTFFGYIQIMNDSLNQRFYITLPNRRMLMGDYSTALTPKDIKWMKWRFDVEATTIALINTDTLLIGSQREF